MARAKKPAIPPALLGASPETLERLVLLLRESTPADTIRTAEDSATILVPLLTGHETERLAVVFLNTRLRVIATEVLSIGGTQHTVVEPRVIFRRALLLGAHAIVIAHNHPSGDPEPSTPDIEVTKSVAASGKMLGITLLDHIVIGGTRWVSIAQRGYL